MEQEVYRTDTSKHDQPRKSKPRPFVLAAVLEANVLSTQPHAPTCQSKSLPFAAISQIRLEAYATHLRLKTTTIKQS